MNIIKIRHPYQSEQIPEDDVVLVLGFFDGVHIGHQKVIKTGMEIAQKEGLKLALMTFNQHPSIVFKKIDPSSVKYLTSLKQKEEKMAALGIDYLYEVDFTSSFAHLAPQEFVDQYIVGLHAKYAVSGFDYTYGPKDIADVAHFPEYAKGRFKIVTVSKEEEQGEKISSTRIRGLLDSGIKIGETWYPAMGSIGHNDTFGEGRELTVELYILDFNQDIYGEHVAVRWNQFLRDQVKFSSVEELIEQLKEDEQATAEYFSQQ